MIEGGIFVEIPFEQVRQQLVEEQGRWQPYALPPYGKP